jgi:hypothetical protein
MLPILRDLEKAIYLCTEFESAKRKSCFRPWTVMDFTVHNFAICWLWVGGRRKGMKELWLECSGEPALKPKSKSTRPLVCDADPTTNKRLWIWITHPNKVLCQIPIILGLPLLDPYCPFGTSSWTVLLEGYKKLPPPVISAVLRIHPRDSKKFQEPRSSYTITVLKWTENNRLQNHQFFIGSSMKRIVLSKIAWTWFGFFFFFRVVAFSCHRKVHCNLGDISSKLFFSVYHVARHQAS